MSAAPPQATAATSDPLASFPQIPVDNTLGAWLLGVAASFLWVPSPIATRDVL